MKKIAIVTDSSCDIPEVLLKKFNIFMLPLLIIYKDGEYEDRIDINPEQIYDRFKREVPKTSLPSAQKIHTLLDRLVEEGYTDIVGLFISSGLSGTYNLVKQIFSEEKRLNINLFDTKSLSLGLGFIVLEIAKALQIEENFKKINAMVENLIPKTKCFYVIKTLEYLKKGGRIGKVEGTIGELLNIKPIISVGEDGIYYTYKKVRGRNKSLAELLKIVQSYAPKYIRVGLLHGGAEQEASKLKEIISGYSHVKELLFEQISPVLTVHTGPGLVGVACQEIG